MDKEQKLRWALDPSSLERQALVSSLNVTTLYPDDVMKEVNKEVDKEVKMGEEGAHQVHLYFIHAFNHVHFSQATR